MLFIHLRCIGFAISMPSSLVRLNFSSTKSLEGSTSKLASFLKTPFLSRCVPVNTPGVGNPSGKVTFGTDDATEQCYVIAWGLLRNNGQTAVYFEWMKHMGYNFKQTQTWTDELAVSQKNTSILPMFENTHKLSNEIMIPKNQQVNRRSVSLTGFTRIKCFTRQRILHICGVFLTTT